MIDREHLELYVAPEEPARANRRISGTVLVLCAVILAALAAIAWGIAR